MYDPRENFDAIKHNDKTINWHRVGQNVNGAYLCRVYVMPLHLMPLAIYTGQRLDDLDAMKWGRKIEIPVHQDLKSCFGHHSPKTIRYFNIDLQNLMDKRQLASAKKNITP